MQLADEFRRWVKDPARTVDDLCAVEVFLEWGERIWKSRNNQHSVDYQAEQRKRKERGGNPAYRPKISKTALDRTIEISDHLIKYYYSWHDDRPLRSLQPFRFFPKLEEISFGPSELTDLAPLRELPALRALTIHDGKLTDLSGLAGLPVTDLTLQLGAPWPDLSAIAKLPNLKNFKFTGNVLALVGIDPLHHVEKAALNSTYHWKTPLRRIGDLPRMPAVRSLRVESAASLEGIANFGRLRSLDLVGPYTDLDPLTAVATVTYLRLEGEMFMDLTHLTRLPNLREILMRRERPLDVGPLAEAPALRQVTVEHCAILRTEVAALNAALPPWALDFLAPEPRPLKPARVFRYRAGDPEVKQRWTIPEPPDGREEFYEGDEHYAHAEARWFAGELQQRLDTLLGRGWGEATTLSGGAPGYQHLTFERYKDVIRLDEIIQTVRELMAACKFKWQCLISAEPHGDLSKDMADIRAQREEEERDWLDQEYDPEQEREDYEEFRKMRRELYDRLEREHRLRLLQQQGEEINPADFSPSAAKPEKASPRKAAADDDDDFEEEDDEGDLADQEEAFESEFGEELSFVFNLTEHHVWVTEHMLENFEATVGLRSDDWHALPEPVESRPRPR